MADLTEIDALAAYGRAMAKVQALEQLMRVALGEEEARRLLRPGAKPKLTGEQLLNMDFGKLEQRVCGKFRFDKEMTAVMSDARGFRNSLAHNFWVHHLAQLSTSRGATIIIRHAALLERQIEWVAEAIIATTGANAQAYADFMNEKAGSEEDMAGWEAALAESEAVFAEVAAQRAAAAEPKAVKGDDAEAAPAPLRRP